MIQFIQSVTERQVAVNFSTKKSAASQLYLPVVNNIRRIIYNGMLNSGLSNKVVVPKYSEKMVDK